MNYELTEDGVLNVGEAWEKVLEFMKNRFEKDADVKAILFVIGLRELATKKTKFTKEEKQDLMNLALCTIMTPDGYFNVKHLDKEGWPVWEQIKPFPVMNNKDQEEFIKLHIIKYFMEEKLI